MTKENTTQFSCDFCYNFSNGSYSRPAKIKAFNTRLTKEWFRVDNLSNHKVLHACKDCGHKLHSTLNTLDIEHVFVCHEYSDETNNPGIIEVI